jgi:hypothetical protein
MLRRALSAATFVALLAACGTQRDVPAEPAEASRPPRTLPLPGAARQEVVARQLRWEVPEEWIAEAPRTAMRNAQYRVPGAAGDGECIVYYFGPGQGGDATANAVRWAQQFEQPGGASSLDAMRLTTLEGTSVSVRLVEVTGTYDGGMTMTDAPAERKPGYMLLGAIAEGPDAPWFFKFTGPEATVRARRGEFLQMMKSLAVAP